MFQKVLIANRGAIATRIIRTLKTMGITPVSVYAECDRNSLHVQHADEAISLGEGNAADTYLDVAKIIAAARQSGAQAIHPGYGFLSENVEFVKQCTANGLVFIGPDETHIETFGLKHRARKLARSAGVPLLPGSDLLTNVDAAIASATSIGYPVMLKSTAGGGGIGMAVCGDDNDIRKQFDSIRRLGASNFSDDGIFLEKYIAVARHIEVQMFGDGYGDAVAIGDRDCSAQRRNQKVIEECPAPNLSQQTRNSLHRCAEQLLSAAQYANAGTVEFIVDAETETFYFLEVNTRLQVEHGVTEEVYQFDLVEWMLRLAAGELPSPRQLRDALVPNGHAIQVRVYAEDPLHEFRPSPGLISTIEFPDRAGVRVDHWLQAGLEIPPYFDPLLAKLIVKADTREEAIYELQQTLQETQLYGATNNLEYLHALSSDPRFLAAQMTTRYLNDFRFHSSRIDVLHGGTQTTIQDYPGRSGYWHVGVPPSGPFDSYSFRLANRLLENDELSAGLEIMLQGPHLHFQTNTQIVVAGAGIDISLDNEAIELWQIVTVNAGQRLKFGQVKERGSRSYLCIKGGIQCPDYLGSKSTFIPGKFGGHNGRALSTGDALVLDKADCPVEPATIDKALIPKIGNSWTLRTVYGPHGAPDFFTDADIEMFFCTPWQVHYNSSRTGVRLIGPRPVWARKDGGEAGLHPSNIHDNAYAFGTVDFTGDMPVILGPDGPSLGGFVCPATVIQADLWKLGQLRAGDKIRFKCVSLDAAVALEKNQLTSIRQLQTTECESQAVTPNSPILYRSDPADGCVPVVYRAAGDHFLLVEYGDNILDIRLRFRAHALMQSLQGNSLPGVRELTPGIRSLQVHYDSQQISYQTLLNHLKALECSLSEQLESLRVPSRIVHLPLSWNDEACQLAVEKYTQSVRKDAPWCPDNLEFIRRINGLESIEAVKKIVFAASYLVMGLGDVYLGAPVATPMDPRHRLVTTKYNPARTWTAENSVGIGGSYLCVYGMEGPGGYQFIGRTLQMWNRDRQTTEFEQPWLLRIFDQIRFYEVSHSELQQIRRDFPQGRYPLKVEEGHFNLSDYESYLHDNQQSIDAFTGKRQAAFDQELAHWHTTGQFQFEMEEEATEPAVSDADWPEGSLVINSPVTGSVWQTCTATQSHVKTGDSLLVLESMKMEIDLPATGSGVITQLLVSDGQKVTVGQPLIVIKPDSGAA